MSDATMEHTPLYSYRNSIEKCDPLTRRQEAELAARMRGGNDEARNELIQANLKFVVSVARKYAGRGLSLPELVSEGNHGLFKAAERFDKNRGYKFITYGVWWIRQSIHNALRRGRRATPDRAAHALGVFRSEVSLDTPVFEHSSDISWVPCSRRRMT